MNRVGSPENVSEAVADGSGRAGQSVSARAARVEPLEPRVLLSAESLAGDFNGSGVVEQGDLDLVLQHWGRDVAADGLPGGWGSDLPVGLIDQGELDRVLANWGEAFSPSDVPGDYDNSGQVDQGDLDLLLQNWGQDPATQGVPEGWVQEVPTTTIGQAELDALLANWGAHRVATADYFVSWFTIGWSGADPAKRHIGRNLDNLGWSGWIERDVLPQIEGGVTRFMLHNPWGVLPGENMQLDQLLHAREAGLDFVTQGFVEAWKPITDAGVEVIAYVGSGLDDPDFDGLGWWDWRQRAMDSVRLMVDAGMSIALDAAVIATEGSHTHRFAEELRSMGVEVIVEAKPTRFTPHWWDYGMVSLDQNFLDDDLHTGHPHAQNYGIENSVLTGEIMRIARPRREDGSLIALVGPLHQQRVEEIISEGHTAVSDMHYWFRTGRTLDEFIAPTIVVRG